MDFFEGFKELKRHGFNFCKLKKAQKTWIEFFANVKKLKKYEFNFLQA